MLLNGYTPTVNWFHHESIASAFSSVSTCHRFSVFFTLFRSITPLAFVSADPDLQPLLLEHEADSGSFLIVLLLNLELWLHLPCFLPSPPVEGWATLSSPSFGWALYPLTSQEPPGYQPPTSLLYLVFPPSYPPTFVHWHKTDSSLIPGKQTSSDPHIQ